MNSSAARIRPVILSGGLGKRLWPVSSDYYPKQFTKLIGNESLFLSTLKRVHDRARYAAPIIVGNVEHMPFIFVELSLLGITDATIILEPCGRSTASAAIVAALSEKEKNMLHLVLPSDHHISDEAAFHDAVAAAATAAHDHLVLFGITPTRPDTGYGYIIPGKTVENTGTCAISVFAEKPNATHAAVLINQGASWNSGMFFYSPETLKKEAMHLAPEHWHSCKRALENATPEKNCIVLRLEDYLRMESHAFDTLFMERTERGAVLACSIGWSDVGSWHSLWQMADKDKNGNALAGAVTVKDVNNSYIRCDGVSVAALGMEDCLIVTKNNNVLVANRSRAQDVKELLADMDKDSGVSEKDAVNDFGMRPWGIYKTIAEGKNFRVKHIVLWPGRSISLQFHNCRTEQWTIISGTAKVECDKDVQILKANQSAFIPRKAQHRLSNAADEDLHVIEVQSGEYLGEDDIIRLEDMYGRV